MRRLLPVALLAALAGAKPGPDTALSLAPVEPIFAVKVVELPSCPPMFEVELTADMPDPGWTLAIDRVLDADTSGRRIVEITATHGEGAWPQVITPRTAKVRLGILRKGVHLLDLHLRKGAGKHERVQAVVLRGAGLRDG